MSTIEISLLCLIVILIIILILLFKKLANNDTQEKIMQQFETHQKNMSEAQLQQLNYVSKTMENSLNQVTLSLNNANLQNEQKLENIRNTIEKRLQLLQSENTKKLDEMRNVVDEKLQKTLEERISKSFSLVSERLEQVSKGLGEMSNLATGVGDLKRVLTNVKTRGTLGEIQLAAILEEILTPSQYDTNVATIPNSTNRVEFAIKFPYEQEKSVYLPIDSKFPLEDYQRLLEAYETGNAVEITTYQKKLATSVKSFAKDIKTKYVQVPHTTDFGVLFLPIEGLYAELVKIGMVEILQREYQITLAGPTTMAALLNSFQMGFRTLAIQKRSVEVWSILSDVKTEFHKFEDVLKKHQERLDQANVELDKLVGTRTRKIVSKLNKIDSYQQIDNE
ncbi:MAG: DNA recombination protein RmuC [Erysipelotrichaceae bacterium]